MFWGKSNPYEFIKLNIDEFLNMYDNTGMIGFFLRMSNGVCNFARYEHPLRHLFVTGGAKLMTIKLRLEIT